MLWVSTVSSFLLLNRVSFYGCAVVSYPTVVERCLDCFQFGALKNKADMNICYKFLYGHMLLFLLNTWK